jgi:hypothetical protein
VRSAGRASNQLRRLAAPGLAIAAALVSLGATGPAPFVPTVVRNLNESGGGASAGGGTGGTVLATLAPLLLVGLAVAVVVLVGGAIVLFRTRGAVAPPASAEGWWTCANCGAGNLDGASRCHACSTWRTTTARPTPSAQP